MGKFFKTCLAQSGVQVQHGNLTDPASLEAGARAADGVIHTAFIHDFSAFDAACATDLRAVQTLASALAGTGKPFVSTSGIALLAPGRIAVETDRPDPAAHRSAAEAHVLDASRHGVRSSVVRLPPSVHGAGDHGFVPILIDLARRTGVAAYIGDGANRWPAVHRFDAARLYRLALESAAPGSVLHGIGEGGIAFREIAAAIGAGLNLPVRAIEPAEAAAHFGWFARFAAIDAPASGEHTCATLGWQAREIGLIDDIATNGYFG